ncbi:MAG: alginate lyase family protein [Phycisphaeraceae bacterium]
MPVNVTPHPHVESFARSLIQGLDHHWPTFADVDWRRPLPELAAVLGPLLREAVFAPACEPMSPDAPANPASRFSRPGETAGELAERCINEQRWVSVGREYGFPDGPAYNVSPDPSLNTVGLPFGEWTWQFNRHHEWAVLARLHASTGDERCLRAMAGWMRQWLEQCPPPAFDYNARHGSWRTIEIGIRLAQTWPRALAALRHSDAVDDMLWLAWLGSWTEQAAFVWQHRKANNWLMMEMAGLLAAGVCLPFHRDAALWRKLATDVMLDETDRQFHPDGHQVELSTNYHMVCVYQYLTARELLRGAGHEPPARLDAVLSHAYEPMRAMARPDGLTFGFQDTTPMNLAGALGRLPVELRGSYDAWFIAGEGAAPPHVHDVLPYAGYVVLRSGRGEADLALAFDGGPYGAAHQHEDKLGLQLVAHGTELIGEAGLVDYADSPQRRYSLTTRAHSTALLDGLDQNRAANYHRDTLVLDRRAALECDLNADVPWARATYDEGYGPEAAVAVAHTRTVALLDADTVVIHDRFAAGDEAEHTAEVLFHVLVEPVQSEGATLLSRGPAANLAIAGMRLDGGVLDGHTVTGGQSPDLRGWAQRPMNELAGTWEPVPRPCLTLTGRFTGAMEVVTVVRVFPAGEVAVAPAVAVRERSLHVDGRVWPLPDCSEVGA